MDTADNTDFDAFLDQLAKQDTNRSATEGTGASDKSGAGAGTLPGRDSFTDLFDHVAEESTIPEPSAAATVPQPAAPPTDDFDALFNGILEEEPAVPVSSAATTVPQPAAPPTDDFDALFNGILEEEPAVPVSSAATTAPEIKSPPSPAVPAKKTEPEAPKEAVEEDPWAQAFAEQEALNKQRTEKTEPEAPKEAVEEDPWAQAFAEQEALNKQRTEKTEPEAPKEAVEEDPWAQAFAEQEALNKQRTEKTEPAVAPAAEEDLWAQAFADQENLNKERTGGDAGGAPAPMDDSAKAIEAGLESLMDFGDMGSEPVAVKTDAPTEEGTAAVTETPEEAPAQETLHEETTAEETAESSHDTDYDEDKYSDEDAEDFPDDLKKKKKRFLGFIPVPESKTGKMVFAGSVFALLAVAGGAYFVVKTFMPPATGSLEQAEAPAPEDQQATPEAQEPAPASEPPASQQAPATAPSAEPATKEPTDTLKNEIEKIQKKPEEEKKSAGEKGAAPEIGVSKEALSAALAPAQNVITMSSIMPVAFNATDIKVLSFTLEVEFSTPQAAEMVRKSLPVFEKIMVTTVEGYLSRKFYNDILYVKEKLQTRLKASLGKAVQGGDIQRIKFKEFDIL
jgi:hypothetical protein